MKRRERTVRLDGLGPHNPKAWTPAPLVPGESAASLPVFSYEKPKVRRLTRKQILMIGGGIIGAVLLFLVGKALLAGSKVITRNAGGGAPALAGNVDPNKLKSGDSRVNILIMGVGGPGHEGPYLSDTNIVMSIDPRTKDVAMLSIPRDLYVPIPGYGSTKINAADAYGEAYKYPGGGGALAKLTVSKVLDIPIHYYIRIDFGAFKQAVDSVGGVDITVQHSLYDPEYPCDNDQGRACGFSIAAGRQHMNGALALKYSRCRKGNCGDDFGRAARQQQIIFALRQKALSLQTLSNPAKISGLIDSVGDHVKTDIQPGEMTKLISLMKDLDTSKVVSKVLDDSADGVVTTADLGAAGSVVIPKAGVTDFSEVRAFVHQLFVDNYLKDENATVEVQNGTTRSGLATTVGKMLTSYNYNVTKMTTADKQNYATTMLYDYTGGKKPYTIHALEDRFHVKAQKATPATGDGDIKLILGADYKAGS